MTGFTVVWCLFFLGNHQLLYIYIWQSNISVASPKLQRNWLQEGAKTPPFHIANNYQPQVGMISDDRHAGWS